MFLSNKELEQLLPERKEVFQLTDVPLALGRLDVGTR